MKKKLQTINLTKELAVSIGDCPDYSCDDTSHHKYGITDKLSAEEADRIREMLMKACRELEAYSKKLRSKD